jgi:hypothetical protein
MSWLDIIGIGIIFPTIVALISYFLTRQDKKIESLHSQIIGRLLSFKKGIDEDKTRTLESLSLEESLYEISRALEEDVEISKESVRVDIEYDVYAHKAEVLKRLRDKVKQEKRKQLFMYGVLIAAVIVYFLVKILVKNGIIQI